MKAGLVAIVVLHAASVFVAAFHQRATFRQSRTHTTQLALKKIADEESSVSAGSKVSEASAKAAKKKSGGKRSSSKEGSEDWRSKKGLTKADAVVVNQEAEAAAAAEQAAREAEAEALEAASAAAEAAVAEETVPATSVVAAIAASTAAEQSPEEDAEETLKFIETMSAGAQQMSVDGLFDTPLGEKKKTKKQRQEEAGIIQQQQEASNPLDALLRVPRQNPLAGGILPPEVVFFGEPRRPPPVYVSTNLDFRSNLLYWARHGNVVPRDSTERLARVFPRGVLEKDSKVTRHRLSPAQLSSYEGIYKAWSAVMDDLEEAKAFISANVDTVPPALFLRAMTAKKLAAQSKGDVAEMTRIKDVRQKYMVAKDQLFFPLNVERIKAETRVMTYLARDEVRNFAKSWDEVEMSLYMTSLVAARMKWDFACGEIMSNIKAALELTVEYMRENTYETLVQKEFRKPSITADTYRNASLNLQFNMPALYEKISPEVKIVHETYFLMEAGESDEALRHMQAFCAKEGVAEGLLKDRLKVFESSIACLQVRRRPPPPFPPSFILPTSSHPHAPHTPFTQHRDTSTPS